MAYIASWVFVCTLIISWCLGGVYARYTTTDEASDSARVAAFTTDALLQNGSAAGIADIDLTLKPSSPTATYQVKVTYNSEVAVRCKLSVENVTGNIPLDIVILNDTVSFAPTSGASEHIFTFTVAWDDASIGTENYMHAGAVDQLAMRVSCEQID